MSVPLHQRSNPSTRSHPAAFRYLAELAVGILLFCITLHTFFLAGLIVPVTVAGGSMAKTILGPRREARCDACGIVIACGHDRLPTSGTAVCLNCGASGIDLHTGRDYPGERALVDRASLAFHPPRRWEVIVFRCPEQPDEFCVKRVVGLPGEAIRLHRGDVFVNGRIARKTLAQCRAVAQLVHDSSYSSQEPKPGSRAPRWRAETPESHWRELDAGFLFQADDTVPKNAPEKIQWLEFHPLRDKPVTDNYAYNQSESRRLNLVTDLMLRGDLAWRDADAFFMRGQVDGKRYDLIFSESDHQVRLQQEGKTLATGILPPSQGDAQRWEVLCFDHQLFVTWENQSILTYPFPSDESSTAEQAVPSAPWAIGMRAGAMELSNLEVLRDIYYTAVRSRRHPWGVGQAATLADDAYFVLGDNSPISADSRIWKSPGISRKSLVGRLLGHW